MVRQAVSGQSSNPAKQSNLEIMALRKGVDTGVIGWGTPRAESLHERFAFGARLAEGRIKGDGVDMAGAGRGEIEPAQRKA